jgi:serine/threonine-protein kinase
MSSSSQRTRFRLVNVDDLDPEHDKTIADGLIGRTIGGRYTIQAHLGGGGMADVFRASDAELGIDVAIKMLKPEIATGDMRARMVQEAQAAAQVRHWNLVRVFGTGQLDGSSYIAMELLDGPNLETYLRERPGERLPWNEALELLLPALEALHAVHERGFVHRDIKPGNILVSREPGCPPRAVVIDLGLVKPDRALRSVAGPPTTEVGRVMCTPGYASPEQVSERPVDRRSDVYSMAITLYRVLAGRLPFHEARGKPIYVVFAHHVRVEPTRLVEAAGDADIPPAIAAVIESALAKDPTDRPQTMQAFADALQRAALSSSPPPRSPFHLWPSTIVLAQLLILLLAWRMATVRGVAPQVIGQCPVEQKPVLDPPVPSTPDPPEPSTPDPPLDSATTRPPAQPTPQPATVDPKSQQTRRHDATTAARQELARHAQVIQACADQTTAGSLERLAVAVNIDTAGHVSAHVDGAVDTPLSRCLGRSLRRTTFSPPSRPLSFVHVFKLRAPPRRP